MCIYLQVVAAAETLAKSKARQVAKKGVGRGGEVAGKQQQQMAHSAKQEQQKAPASRKRGAAAKESMEGAKESMEGQHPAQVYMICMMCVCVCVCVCVYTHTNIKLRRLPMRRERG